MVCAQYSLSTRIEEIRSKCAQYAQSAHKKCQKCALGTHGTRKVGRLHSPGECNRPLSTRCAYYAYFLHTLCVLFTPCVHDVRTCAYQRVLFVNGCPVCTKSTQSVQGRNRFAQYAQSAHTAGPKCTWGVRGFAQYAQSTHKVHMGGEKFARSVHQDRQARHIVPVLSIWLARDTDASLRGSGCSTQGQGALQVAHCRPA